ncbi:hypothetical protein ED733_001069 [Metarhizium rileyi]|uniref:Uncharacterized protein n=1 Tax=Metarhizium rileyi (strain RCEF 4871) TaxID=1649241 RepID=A0A5C6G5K9_METRR|nr:hypothetical protein ED733_001069 [Metarhizium rileyi]
MALQSSLDLKESRELHELGFHHSRRADITFLVRGILDDNDRRTYQSTTQALSLFGLNILNQTFKRRATLDHPISNAPNNN